MRFTVLHNKHKSFDIELLLHVLVYFYTVCEPIYLAVLLLWSQLDLFLLAFFTEISGCFSDLGKRGAVGS